MSVMKYIKAPYGAFFMVVVIVMVSSFSLKTEWLCFIISLTSGFFIFLKFNKAETKTETKSISDTIQIVKPSKGDSWGSIYNPYIETAEIAIPKTIHISIGLLFVDLTVVYFLTKSVPDSTVKINDNIARAVFTLKFSLANKSNISKIKISNAMIKNIPFLSINTPSYF